LGTCQKVASILPQRNFDGFRFLLEVRWSDLTITASLHHCITASLHHCITASLHHCITASLHHCITASANESEAFRAPLEKLKPSQY
jgi:hypothetical protein